MKKALLTLFFAIASRSYAVEFGDIPADYTLYSAGDPFAIALATNNAAVKMNINNGTSTNQTLRLPMVADRLSFSLGAAPALGAGEIAWDPDWLTFKAGLSNGVEGQFFQEHHIVAKNAWTNTIPNGWIVMHSGVVGNSGKYEVVPAISTPALDPTRVIGMTTEDIPVGALGRITARGNVNEIGSDGSLYGASGWQNNTPVYLCTTHVGWVTTNLIQAPYPRIYIGNIVRAHSSGAIYIRVQPGLRLADLDDVDGTPLTTTGQFPVYDSVRGVFDFDRNVSEFLLASAFGTWLSTNTYVRAEVDQAALAALAAYAATNRATILRDAGDASVWWVAHGGTNLTAYTLAMSWVVRNEALTVIEGENPPFAARATPRPDIPYPLPAEGYWALDGEITIGTLDGWVSAWLPDTTAWGAAPFASSDHYTLIPISNELIGNIYLDYQSVTNLVGSYNLTTGNVWQAVSAVRQTADDAQLAADQAATLINYHTTLDGNPHAGKLVSMSNGTATNLTIVGGNVSGDTLIGAQAITNAILDQTTMHATYYGYASITSTIPGALRLTNALPTTPLATVTNLATTNNAYVAKFITGTGLRFSRISEGTLSVHMHHRKGAAGAATLRPELYLLDANGNKLYEYETAQSSDPLTVALGDSTIQIPIPSNITVAASNRLGIYIKATVTSGSPDIYIDTEDNVNFIVGVPVPSAEFVTQSDIANYTTFAQVTNTVIGMGAITNGQNGVSLGTSTINGDLTITPSGIGTAFWTMNRFDGQPLYHFTQVYGGGSWDLEMKRNAALGYVTSIYYKRDGAVGINTDMPSAALDVKIADDGYGVKYNGLRVRIGDTNLFTVSSNGVVTCASTNIAAVVSSQGPVLLGPTIGGRQAFTFSDGTNLFFVNVNYVTNSITTN